MKRLTFVTICLLAMSMPLMAQSWGGWLIGASGDVFWDQPVDKMFSKPRLQLSKVFQVGDNPHIVSMPGISWRTTNGEVGIEGMFYHQFLTHGNWQFFAGGGVAPLIIETDNGGKIAKKGNVLFDLMTKYDLGSSYGFVGGLRVDWQAPYSTIPETNIGTVVTLTLGFTADALGF